MRHAVVNIIYEAARKDKRICFLTGDLAHVHQDEFKEHLSSQYFNLGMAEQNMIGVAGGLALAGNKVFVYSITPFVTMRCYEQIKVDLCYQNLDVTVIGVGAGFAYATSGCTHHAIEDIAIMRVLPNIKIYSPSSPMEAGYLTRLILQTPGPSYLRIGRGGESELNPTSQFEKMNYANESASVFKEGDDVTIFSTGSIVQEALDASFILKKKGISSEVVNITQIKPIDRKLVLDRWLHRKAIFVLEEHNIIGGLGGAISEIVSGQKSQAILKLFGIPDVYTEIIGSQSFLRKKFALDGPSVAKEIQQYLS